MASDRPLLAIVPFSDEYGADRLFEATGGLDRDGTLSPWRMLADELRARGWTVVTADRANPARVTVCLHLDSRRRPPAWADPARTVLMVFEPEIVAPFWYDEMRARRLPFPRVYTYDLSIVATGSPYAHLEYPQTLPQSVLTRERTEHLVLINARKYPVRRRGELYSERERVAAWFARRGHPVSVYGRGWDRSSRRHPIADLRTRHLRKVARGPVTSKYDVLAGATFALCFENMRLAGYHTEKLFDAIAAGCVPIYCGDPRITDIVPSRAYVDYDALGSPAALHRALAAMGEEEIEEVRSAGQAFLTSAAFLPYTPRCFAERLTAVVEELCAA